MNGKEQQEQLKQLWPVPCAVSANIWGLTLPKCQMANSQQRRTNFYSEGKRNPPWSLNQECWIYYKDSEPPAARGRQRAPCPFPRMAEQTPTRTFRLPKVLLGKSKSTKCPHCHIGHTSTLTPFTCEEPKVWRRLNHPAGKQQGQNQSQAGHQWLTPVILATQEAEIRRIAV
jgi:hypothetical protein